MKLGTSGAAPPAQAAAPALSPARAYEESLAAARHARGSVRRAGGARAEHAGAVPSARCCCCWLLVQRSLGPLALLGAVARADGRLHVRGRRRAPGCCRGAAGTAASATLSLTLALLALMLHAWHSGLGTHSIVLGGAVLLVAVAGILVNMPHGGRAGRASTCALIAGLEVAENRGAHLGAAALAQLHAESRALSFAHAAVAGAGHRLDRAAPAAGHGAARAGAGAAHEPAAAPGQRLHVGDGPPRPSHLPVAVVRDAHAAHGRGVHAAGQARRPDLRARTRSGSCCWPT